MSAVRKINPQRMYQPIWEILKRDGVVAITTHTSLHPRIKKAVMKEKDMDLGYKVLLAETHHRATLVVKIDGSKMTFRIRKSIGLGDI